MRTGAKIGIVVIAAAMAAFWYLRRDSGASFPTFVKTADQNVLLITIDTLRADALGIYGGRAATPNIDTLARDGIRFTFAHAHVPVTLPSHASILTGRYPYEHGVRDNAGYRLDDAAITIAEVVRAKGIATGAFVGAFPVDRRFGLDQGFDVYDDAGGRGLAETEFALSERRAEAVVASARAWIAQQAKPWFVWVHVFDPHAPYGPPAPFDRQYTTDPYAGEVSYVDQSLRPLIDLARGSERPTTIVLTADHGEGLGEHGETTHGTFAYETTLRVPLILAQVGGPGLGADSTAGARSAKAAGQVSDVPVRHVDIVPTIGDLLGLQLPGDLPGRTLANSKNDDAASVPSYFETMTPMLTRGWAPLRGVIVAREKYIDLPIEELYDLQADSREERNLAPSAVEDVRRLRSQLAAQNAAQPGAQRIEDPEARARLESLGYVARGAPRKARFTEADDPKRLIDIDRLMLEGIELYQAGRAAEAMEAYRQVIGKRPDMTMAHRRLAFMQWETGAPASAIATLRDALRRNGPDVDIEVRLGTYLAETGELAEATAILERTVRAEPKNSEALNALGIARARGGRQADALGMFEQILAIDPRNVHALENIATVHLQLGHLSAAADAFSRAVAIDPRSSRARAGLGVVALQSNKRDEAIEHWRRAVEIDPRNFDALFNLATELVNAGRLADARPYLAQFVGTAPPAFYARDIERMRGLLR
jgi:arylsulfatase A-like enzyme/Tfp pilus assembly protein PilF